MQNQEVEIKAKAITITPFGNAMAAQHSQMVSEAQLRTI